MLISLCRKIIQKVTFDHFSPILQDLFHYRKTNVRNKYWVSDNIVKSKAVARGGLGGSTAPPKCFRLILFLKKIDVSLNACAMTDIV